MHWLFLFGKSNKLRHWILKKNYIYLFYLCKTDCSGVFFSPFFPREMAQGILTEHCSNASGTEHCPYSCSCACCWLCKCVMQEAAREPSVKGNPCGALHNSHMQNDTAGFSLFLHGACFLFLLCHSRLGFCLFKWTLQFNFFFPKKYLDRAVCTFCFIFKCLYTQLYDTYFYTHKLLPQLSRPQNFWNPLKEYLCCLLWADLSYLSLCFRLEKNKE